MASRISHHEASPCSHQASGATRQSSGHRHTPSAIHSSSVVGSGGAQPLFTFVNPAGKTEYAFKKLGFAHNPIVPHTVTRASRTCESCHGNPRALGLGAFTSREHPKLGEFGQPSDYRWDRIVDEDGHPLQATTVEGARPLNREEMDRIRSAPFKVPGGSDDGRYSTIDTSGESGSRAR